MIFTHHNVSHKSDMTLHTCTWFSQAECKVHLKSYLLTDLILSQIILGVLEMNGIYTSFVQAKYIQH